jgi:hypothetical protein
MSGDGTDRTKKVQEYMMSAYIVADNTIEKILNGIQLFDFKIGPKDKDMRDYFESQKFCILRKIGDDLYKLNRKSVNFRYNERAKSPRYNGVIRLHDKIEYFKPVNISELVQIKKAIDCYLYQSCEGNCSKSKLYKQVELLGYTIASEIVDRMPEYQAAEWG